MTNNPAHVRYTSLQRIKRFATSVILPFSSPYSRRLAKAKGYVGTNETSGKLQFELLKREGCQPTSKVLEIGCGCLNLGIPLIEYLETGNYAGIDPNAWLRETSMERPQVKKLVDEKQARFLTADDFDGSSFNTKFDYIYSHSILSHCAHLQLQQFLDNTAKVLAPKGRILSSIRLAEGNAHGSTGSPDGKDSMDKEWVYPGISWFTLSTVKEMADKAGLNAVHIPEYTEFITKTNLQEFHDWILFTRKEDANEGKPA